MTRLDARSSFAAALAAVLAAACLSVAVHRSVYAAEAGAAAERPAIDLAEKGAFPLPAHLESADIAAGKHDFEHLFKSGDALFHTAFNGLDGVGMAVLGNGTKVNRFTGTPPGGGAARPVLAVVRRLPPLAVRRLGRAGADADRVRQRPGRQGSVQRALDHLVVRRRHPATPRPGDHRGPAPRA